MTAFALVSGALSRAPELKTAKSGKAYVTATIKVAADNAVDFWSVLAFSESAQAELSRLGEGDKISAQGSFKVEPYTARDGQTRINRTHLCRSRSGAATAAARAQAEGRAG